jgi:multiple sugar transport system substrate-binding protein
MRRLLAMSAAVVMIVGACSSGATQTPAGSTGTGASTNPGESAGGSTAPSGGGFDPASISGTATLSGWQSSDAENAALKATVTAFEAAYPKIKVDYKVIAGDYATVMATNFASKNVPDLFYVDAAFAQPWSDQGFLEPLDDDIAKQGFDTTPFFPGYLSVFKGRNGLKAPMCLNPGLDRGLAFVYAQGGAIVSDDGTTNMSDSAATKTAVQWYLDQFKNGNAMTASDMGDGWCGDSLGKKHAAFAFEGGWLDPAMTSTYPTVKYAWGQFPTGTSGSPVTISYTAAYAIGADSANKDQAWVLLQYLAGKDGMTKWTSGGVALPSRSDVPTPAGKDVLVAQAAFAKPGSGFMKGYSDVQKAFQDAFTLEIQHKTYSADPVIAATKAAVDKALGS